MKLYGYWRSSSTWRVRTAVAYKGLQVEHVRVNLRAGEQHQPGYVLKSPAHTIPLLELEDGRCISQSMAILAYLEEAYPTPSLLPLDPVHRAWAREMAELVNSGIQPLQNLQVLKRVKQELHGDDAAWAAHWIAQGLSALEVLAVQRAGTFSIGESLSLADMFIVPQLYNARRFGADVSHFPTLLRVEAACLALPAFQVAHPDRQPDAEKDV